jgi:alkyl sulfatase BDS1-like metallo-beta-lactamase superfamily hydrolase
MRVTQTIILATIFSFALSVSAFAGNDQQHFHPKGKMPSTYTVELQKKLRETLPFKDKQDFAEQKKGFIAAPDYKQIMAEAGHVAWDMGKYEFLLEGKDFDSIHPSLQRQAILNMNYGLYEVVPGIYQVRGYDLANISFIKSKTGWIIFDPLTAKETAKAALDFINEKLGKRPVVARSRSLPPLASWIMRFPRMFMPVMPCPGACSISMVYCCRPARLATWTSPSARTRLPAISA